MKYSAFLNSELIKEWSNKNIITPLNLTKSSNKKVWWKCKKGHEWESSLLDRKRNRGCPFCSGRRVCIDNCLATLNPKLAFEWNYERNEKLTPNDVTQFSSKKVWWRCKNGHEWQALISNRSKGAGCKKCNNPNVSIIETKIFYFIQQVFPDSIQSYKLNSDKNFKTLLVDIFIPSLNLVIEYDGFFYHKSNFKLNRDSLKSKIITSQNYRILRIREIGLPEIGDEQIVHCTNINLSLKILITDLYKWFLKNFNLSLYQIKKINSITKVDFENYIYPDNLFTYKIQENSLENINPKLCAEWNFEKNGNLKPNNVTTGSNKKVWWICSKSNNHVWLATVNDRARQNRGCPYCAGDKVCVDNCLSFVSPDLVKEWNYEKNLIKPSEVTKFSTKKVWWKCSHGHEWEAYIYNRSNGFGKCKICKKNE